VEFAGHCSYINNSFASDLIIIQIYYSFKMLNMLVFFFRKLGLDLVPRCGAEMVDPATMSAVELYKVVCVFNYANIIYII